MLGFDWTGIFGCFSLALVFFGISWIWVLWRFRKERAMRRQFLKGRKPTSDEEFLNSLAAPVELHRVCLSIRKVFAFYVKVRPQMLRADDATDTLFSLFQADETPDLFDLQEDIEDKLKLRRPEKRKQIADRIGTLLGTPGVHRNLPFGEVVKGWAEAMATEWGRAD